MQQGRTEGQWESLSTDLWAAIFMHLQPRVDSEYPRSLAWRFTDEVKVFYELRTVCFKFEKVFSQTPQLYSTLGLQKNLGGQHLMDMFSWIKQYGDNLEGLVSTTAASWRDVTLTALLALQSPGRLSRLSTVCTMGLTRQCSHCWHNLDRLQFAAWTATLEMEAKSGRMSSACRP